MYKKDIINFLFIISFPVMGLGFFVSGHYSPSIGSVFGVIPYVLIIAFYLIDSLYKRRFDVKLNSTYWLFLVFMLLIIISFYTSVSKHFPYFTSAVAIGKMFIVVLPFHAFLIVMGFNEAKEIPRLTLLSLTILIFLNIIGFFVLGLENANHSIEGRVNFPFIDSFYSGSGVLCVISLMVIYEIRQSRSQSLKRIILILYLLLNLVLLFFINSRLMILILLGVFVLYLFNTGFKSRIIYFVSIFTVPILLNANKLIYEILSLPIFGAILQRVDMEDVMTFNGRSYLWENTIEWLFDDQRGILFGNGYRGHYFLRLIDEVMKVWDVETYNSHLHSTAAWTLIDLGLFGFFILIAINFTMFDYFRKQFQEKKELAIFYLVVLYMIFVSQVDAFGYLDNAGGVIVSLLFALTVVNPQQKPISLMS